MYHAARLYGDLHDAGLLTLFKVECTRMVLYDQLIQSLVDPRLRTRNRDLPTAVQVMIKAGGSFVAFLQIQSCVLLLRYDSIGKPRRSGILKTKSGTPMKG